MKLSDLLASDDFWLAEHITGQQPDDVDVWLDWIIDRLYVPHEDVEWDGPDPMDQ